MHESSHKGRRSIHTTSPHLNPHTGQHDPQPLETVRYWTRLCVLQYSLLVEKIPPLLGGGQCVEDGMLLIW